MKFKVFVCVALSLIVLLQAAMVAALLYGGSKIKSASDSVQHTVSQKTDDFTKSTNDINNNLQAIKAELQDQRTFLP